MNQVGELVVAKNRLAIYSAASGDLALGELSDRVSRLVSAMQADVIAARMTPVGEVFDRFPRLVRDLSRDLGKRIKFDMEGEEIELDRSILDEIGDPLLHLIRNAADHGIESPEHRKAADKPAEGRILLSASRERNSVLLRVTDDGRGIDRAAILAKARRDGLADASVESLSDDLLLRVLARPGFSTAEAVSGVSGRGVGVDVAMTRVRSLGGTLEVRSEVGKGTTFAIRVPLRWPSCGPCWPTPPGSATPCRSRTWPRPWSSIRRRSPRCGTAKRCWCATRSFRRCICATWCRGLRGRCRHGGRR